MKNKIGIWIDLRNAWLIELNGAGGEPSVRHLKSGIEESQAGGGFRGQTPWSPQGGDTTRAAQQRRHHEEKEFFEHILSELPAGENEVLIFGPSTARHGLLNVLRAQKSKHVIIAGAKAADQMTEPEMKARVLEYFGMQKPRRLPKR